MCGRKCKYEDTESIELWTFEIYTRTKATLDRLSGVTNPLYFELTPPCVINLLAIKCLIGYKTCTLRLSKGTTYHILFFITLDVLRYTYNIFSLILEY